MNITHNRSPPFYGASAPHRRVVDGEDVHSEGRKAEDAVSVAHNGYLMHRLPSLALIVSAEKPLSFAEV